MRFDPGSPSTTFNFILESIHDEYIRRDYTISELSRRTGYSYTVVKSAMLNRVYEDKGEARTSKRMCTLIDICRSLDLSIIVISRVENFDITEDGYTDLPKRVFDKLKGYEFSTRNLQRVTGFSAQSINQVLKQKGEITSTMGIVQYMRYYHELVGFIEIEVVSNK